jgi:FlgD Ig-like domain
VNRLPLVAFGALVVATVGAFFVTQHLKVSTPLVTGSPHPNPSAISPNETGCGGLNRVARFSFYLLHRADDVAVYIVDQDGSIVRTVASSRHMPRAVREDFPWNGREDNGRIAPDGEYYYRVALLHQGRTIEYTRTPVTVKSNPPRPVVTDVAPSVIPQRGSAGATISYRGTEGRSALVRIYRTDLSGDPQVKRFRTKWGASSATWDGTIHGRPASSGTYLIGLAVQDKACNVGAFPVTIPPPRGLTPRAGVTVRYLAVQPPMDPVRSGAAAVVYVDSRQRPYHWALRRAGNKKVLRHGSGREVALHIHIPDAGAALYELAVRSGGHRAVVPLVASRSRSRAKLLVVLPALTWQGQNAVDDDGDGVPNTLSNGGPIALHRPLVNGLGLPQGFVDEAAFVSYLDHRRLPYDLTTDLGLIDGTGPTLRGHRGVVLAGSERWLPDTLSSALRDYVRGGGGVVSLGIDSLRRGVTVSGATAARPGEPAATDIFGARIGSLVTHNRDFVLVGHDGLRIFSTTSGAFSGYPSFQQFAGVAPPAGPIVSAAGTSTSTDSIIGFPLGRGTVVEVGLVGFGSSLARNTDAQELVNRLWTVLSG